MPPPPLSLLTEVAKIDVGQQTCLLMLIRIMVFLCLLLLVWLVRDVLILLSVVHDICTLADHVALDGYVSLKQKGDSSNAIMGRTVCRADAGVINNFIASPAYFR